jgi:hypothetical protein
MSRDHGRAQPGFRECDTCGGARVIELPELLPCPDCEPAQFLAERVLCGLPTDDQEAIRAARKVQRAAPALPEVECPACGATIRAQLADAPGQLKQHALEAAADELFRTATDRTFAPGVLGRQRQVRVARAVLEAYYRALAAGPESRERERSSADDVPW